LLRAFSRVDLIFYALSDPTRRSILKMLGEGTRTISELAHPFRMSLAAVSKQVKPKAKGVTGVHEG
jgi:DNA-binding transcriptional ArsR family regulator